MYLWWLPNVRPIETAVQEWLHRLEQSVARSFAAMLREALRRWMETDVWSGLIWINLDQHGLTWIIKPGSIWINLD